LEDDVDSFSEWVISTDACAQGFSCDEFHRDEGQSFELAYVVDGDDVGVGKSGGASCFSEHSADGFFPVCGFDVLFAPQDFERDFSA
jgi:hypothetical protein